MNACRENKPVREGHIDDGEEDSSTLVCSVKEENFV